MDNMNNMTELDEKALNEVNGGEASLETNTVSIPKVLSNVELDSISGGLNTDGQSHGGVNPRKPGGFNKCW